jgi:hypothetical protein
MGIEVTRRRGRRLRKLLDDLKERRGHSHLKEEALDRTVWGAGFGRGFGPVVRINACIMTACSMRNFVIYSDYKGLLIVDAILRSQRVVVMALIASLFLLSVFNSFSSIWHTTCVIEPKSPLARNQYHIHIFVNIPRNRTV